MKKLSLYDYVKKLYRLIKKGYGGAKIKWKIMASYILLTIITVLAIGIYSLKYTASIARERYIDALENTLHQLAVDIGNRMESIEKSSEILVWNTELREILSKDSDYSFSEQIKDMEALERIVHFSSNINTFQLAIYITSDAIYSRERRNFFPNEESPFQELYDSLKHEKIQVFWGALEIPVTHSSQSRQVIACMRPIMHNERIFESVGMLVFYQDKEIFDRLLEQSKLTEKCLMFLVGHGGKNVASSEKQLNTDILGIALDSDNKIYYNNTAYYVLQSDIPNQDWKLISLVSDKEINSPITDTVHLYAPLIVIILAIALVLSAFLSTSLTGRISRLAAIMREKTFDLDDAILDDIVYGDEIGELQRAYNQMIKNNQQLINQVYLAEIRERDAEMKALQAQINPHFLYNTLDTINWMALEAGAEKVSGMVSLLASFFRMSLKSSNNVVTIAEEVEHARTYLELQKYRLGEAIEYTIDVDDTVLSYPIVKLTLQPLVENAIIHGIQKNITQSGEVRIYGYAREGIVYLVVEDTGPGFNGNPDLILSANNEDIYSGSGYGIQNTDKRIKLTFGQQYGLRYESPESGGTRAVITSSLTVEEYKRGDKR